MSQLPGSILSERVIPVARGLDGDTAPTLARALLDGGLSTLEVTFEGASGVEALESIRGMDLTIGAGTIVSVKQAVAAVAAGARFIVSPHLVPDIGRWARDNEIPYLPGALTPTEIDTASSLHAAAVKIFPAHLGGPEYLRSLLGPYPDLALVPTGGVNGDNASGYLDAGAVAVGVGGWLTSHQDPGEVTRRARALVSRVV